MNVTKLDVKGLNCPQATIQVTIISTQLRFGDVLEVVADYESFEEDISHWCVVARKELVWIKSDSIEKRCRINF